MPTYQVQFKLNIAGVGEKIVVLSVDAVGFDEAITVAKEQLVKSEITRVQVMPAPGPPV